MAAGFGSLTFDAVPVMVNSGTDAAPNWELNANLVAGTTVIAGILDPTTTQRIFNPVAEGNAVASGDAYTKWLPVLASITAAAVVDNYQSGAPTEYGQITLKLTPAPANVVEAPSVMTYRVSPQAFVITATAGTF